MSGDLTAGWAHGPFGPHLQTKRDVRVGANAQRSATRSQEACERVDAMTRAATPMRSARRKPLGATRMRAWRSPRYGRGVQEPGSAVITTLASGGPAPVTEWPTSQRRVIRCPNNHEEGGSGEVSARSRAVRLRGPCRTARGLRCAADRSPAAGPSVAGSLRHGPGLQPTRPVPLSNRLTRLRHEGRVRRVRIGLWVAS